MLIASRRSIVGLLPAFLLGLSLFACIGLVASPCAEAQTTFFGRQLARLDLGLGATGTYTKDVSGVNYQNTEVSLHGSTTVGALVQLRYVKSPYVGGEFNYGYARFDEDFTSTLFPPTSGPAPQFGVQSQVNEYTFGYLAHPPTFFGLHPFASVGAGSMEFKPTPLGGESLPARLRAVYYYSAGVDQQVSPHFGLRVQFRQLFYKAPDYGQNYLTIQQQTITTEPSAGVYFKF